MTANEHTQETAPECFLCTLDPAGSCTKTLLEGRLINAQERMVEGERSVLVILETGTARVEVLLDGQYYRSLFREFSARSHVLKTSPPTMRIYHLPTAPATGTYKDMPRFRYIGNSYTLAVLEPDTLLNITDLHQAEYCARQFLLRRLAPSGVSSATIRGNMVHYCFKELLKAHDRGYFHTQQPEHEPVTPLQFMVDHLEQALQLNSLDLALADIASDSMREEVLPHLESLAQWFERERTTLWDLPSPSSEAANTPQEQASGNQVRAETFLLAPEIGLRGRLDLFWQQSGRQRLLELKTGGATGDLPKQDHRWQVYGYHALLTVRRDSHMKRAMATLLYSGTPGSATAVGLKATIREIQRVNERRNLLLLSKSSNIPPFPPGGSRCVKCALLTQCKTASDLLDWQPPALPETETGSSEQTVPLQNPNPQPDMPQLTAEERAFFRKYYDLLQLEGRASEQNQALLWKLPVSERIERGHAILGLERLAPPLIEKDGWLQQFRCVNTSELREGDEILLSAGNPVTDEVVSGTIVHSSSEQVSVWTRELIEHPTLLDRYDNDIVHARTQQNLWRWLFTTPHLRNLVAGIRPKFHLREVAPRPDFNKEQNEAVARALQMQDYLLIHGPPGTGKTSVIAEIVKRLCAEGQRVLLAAFTNQAVDNMLRRLEREGFSDYIRLGHERSVDATIRQHLLKTQADQRVQQAEQDLPYGEAVHDALYTASVVASTTATWSSDRYSPQTARSNEEHPADPGLAFDVAIIDEAGQLTIPAILGALRFAKRFILVGDEKQLPPLVLSKEAAEAGLAESLFSRLKALDESYIKRKNNQPGIGACVALLTQYRMNRWIGNFSSKVFYEDRLKAHPAIAEQRLQLSYPKKTQPVVEDVIEQAIRPGRPIVFLDVQERSGAAENKTSTAEAEAIRALVARLLQRGIAASDIGIIAPYRAQVATIRRHLFSSAPEQHWEALPATSPLTVDTVDRFQGAERQVIIISFATSREPAVGSQRRDFLTQAQRLNVALTRAQRKLILVGCQPALAGLPVFSRLLAYCDSMKTLLHYTPGASAELAAQEAILPQT